MSKPRCPDCNSALTFVKELRPYGARVKTVSQPAREAGTTHVGWTAFCTSRGFGCSFKLTLYNKEIDKIWREIKEGK